MIKKELLEILCCPETHASLALASDDLIAETNRKIALGQLKNRAGETVTTPIDGGLLRDDGKIFYVIRKDIPVLLIDQGISLVQG
jgi:uncharacterized protein YbaR (Trm112 family)